MPGSLFLGRSGSRTS
uniref:Uncharacterized protein n=1 Tax=Arundo donax TaxID=35708 RepID=A0A0A9BGR1_ARUDO